MRAWFEKILNIYWQILPFSAYSFIKNKNINLYYAILYFIFYILFYTITAPLSFLYRLIVYLRLTFHKKQMQHQTNHTHYESIENQAFVIVVGNFTVGGSGKTPILIAIAQTLKKQIQTPIALVSRGYQSQIKASDAVFIQADTSNKPENLAATIGDEPALLSQKTALPIAIHPKRSLAVASLEKYFQAKNHSKIIILSDDGMQHLKMRRDIEIAVINDLGNQQLLPLGPLREPLRLVDYILVHNLQDLKKYKAYAKKGIFCVQRSIHQMYHLFDSSKIIQLKNLKDLKNLNFLNDEHKKPEYHVICGIAKPKAFANQLKAYEFEFTSYFFQDHADEDLYIYIQNICEKIKNMENIKVIMTEKDAIKVKNFIEQNNFLNLNLLKNHFFVVPLEIKIEDTFYQHLLQNIYDFMKND